MHVARQRQIAATRPGRRASVYSSRIIDPGAVRIEIAYITLCASIWLAHFDVSMVFPLLSIFHDVLAVPRE